MRSAREKKQATTCWARIKQEDTLGSTSVCQSNHNQYTIRHPEPKRSQNILDKMNARKEDSEHQCSSEPSRWRNRHKDDVVMMTTVKVVVVVVAAAAAVTMAVERCSSAWFLSGVFFLLRLVPIMFILQASLHWMLHFFHFDIIWLNLAAVIVVALLGLCPHFFPPTSSRCVQIPRQKEWSLTATKLTSTIVITHTANKIAVVVTEIIVVRLLIVYTSTWLAENFGYASWSSKTICRCWWWWWWLRD